MFTLQPLPYELDALEPYLSKHSMELHYTKHHQSYVDKLNKALSHHSELYKKSVDWFLRFPDQIPSDSRVEVMRNAGGAYNHTFFWSVMGKNCGGKPVGKLADALVKNFGSFEAFKNRFSFVSNSLFGSGWAWLCFTTDGLLQVRESANHDSPITHGLSIILTLDVWEHAYYAQYENRRADYVEKWWNLVNWQQAEEYYLAAIK